ncbi:DUF554 domain-containing protein [Aciduricibacillus chroicocephali]|uniref:DUF554 domain-containing protein n=1 Tax=Aciduricibacillus chroicocephali TaxID=3054939 RepID=A0ABY9KVS8_9BACI|nr:DUF554 domain-containing protein [Bacillaceae bacterium 44XB]
MVLYGTLINGAFILVGGLLGLLFSNIPEKVKETVMQAISLAVILIGLKMAFETDDIIVLLLSLITGAFIGEFLHIEDKINDFGNWIEGKFATPGKQISIAQGFVTASLIYVVGAMAIVGALDSGLRGDHEILITKGILDGFSALVFTSMMGYGVILSVIPVILYEGAIALLAKQIELLVPHDFLNGLIVQMTGVGGLLIVAIGLNLLNLTKIRIGNLIPALITVIAVYGIYILF